MRFTFVPLVFNIDLMCLTRILVFFQRGHAEYSRVTEEAPQNLEQQLVLCETLDGFQQIGVQAKLVIQLLLALLQTERWREKEGKRDMERD